MKLPVGEGQLEGKHTRHLREGDDEHRHERGRDGQVRTRVKAATVFMIRPSSQTTPERARYCFVNSLDNAEKS